MSTPRLSSAPSQQFAGNARFELRRVLGEGGMGLVYEAYDHERAMVVALKTLRECDAQAVYRLKTEFRARADIEHRNLIRLGELHHDDGHWFFTMELVDGWPFLDWVRNGPPPEDGAPPSITEIAAAAEARLRDAVRQLATGLDVLHRKGKVHRDLKPSNVLITRKGRVVILDFGLVGDLEPNNRSVGYDLVGTAAYMAPEQARSPAVSPAADSYSIGVMMYEAIAGRLPFDGAPLEILMHKQDSEPPPPLGVPTELSHLCMELLRLDPAKRPTARAIVARLSTRIQPDEIVTPFVGRARELAELDAALDEVVRGATHAVFVEGESGIGKSTLVRSFVERVQTRHPGSLVLAGRCYERETLPFKGLDGIVDALARELMRRHPVDVALLLTNEVETLANVFPVLRRVPAIARMRVPRPASPVELRARAFRGLRSLLSALAAQQTVVVVLDDVQWADTDSIALLREILHPPDAPPMLVVITRRGDAGPRPELPGPVRAIAVDPLSPEEGRELIALIAPDREPEAAGLVDDAGGHPMFLAELVRHAGVARSSARFDDALWARITRMETGARRLIELVAIAGGPIPQGVVGQVLGFEPPTLTKLLGTLRATSLVRTGGTRAQDPVEPYHDRVREAVVARLPAARRRRYHEKIAAVLLAMPNAEHDPLTIVRHLEAAGAVEHAGELARRAALNAEEALAFELAAALYAVALRLGNPDDESRRELLGRQAHALSYAGRGPESATAFLAAAEGADSETGFQCRRRAAHELLVSGHVHDGLALLRSVLDEIGEHLPTSTGAARRLVVWRWLRIAVRGTGFRTRATPDARASVDELRLDLMNSASLGLSMVDTIPGAAFQARAVLVALQLGDRRRIAYALTFHAMFVAATGTRIRTAHKLVAQARELAVQLKSRWLLAWTRAGEGITEFFAGHYRKALPILDDAEAQMRECSVGTAAELNHVRNFMLFTLRRLGDYDQLRDRQTEYVRDANRRGDRYAATSVVWSSNVVWLAADDVSRARAELASASWSQPSDGLHLQHWFHVRARAELALYEDDPVEIDALVPEMRAFLGPAFAHIEAVSTETRYQLARVRIYHRDPAGARREVEPIAGVGSPYVRGFVLLVHAAADVLEGRLDRARATLASSIAAFESCEMTGHAALARRRAAELAGDANGIAEADAALTRHGVVAPERFAQLFATWPR